MNSEKWLDSVEVIQSDVGKEDARVLGRLILDGGLPLLPDIVSLDLTNYERSAVASLVEATNRVRNFCGVEPLSISSERVHLVDDELFAKEIGTASGYEMAGHVYLPERLRQNTSRFAYVLSHEVSHVSSFRSVRAELASAPSGPRIVSVVQTRTGLQRLGTNGTEFVGLNEAVTEYLALLLRREVGKTPGPFGKDCGPTRGRIVAAIKPVSALLRLAKQLAQDGVRPEWQTPTDVWKTLLIDYWLGSDVFLDFLKSLDAPRWDYFRTLGVGGE